MDVMGPFVFDKQEVLRLLMESIVVEDNAITIKHIIPTDDNSRLLPRDIRQKYPKSSPEQTRAALQAAILVP